MIYGRDSHGRFISKEQAEKKKELVERTAPTAKIVMFRERIRGTRIAQTIRKAYQPETTDEEIGQDLSNRYDRGGNYVIKVFTIGLGYLKPGDEFIMDTEGPRSADRS
jgi:hypothetical protein